MKARLARAASLLLGLGLGLAAWLWLWRMLEAQTARAELSSVRDSDAFGTICGIAAVALVLGCGFGLQALVNAGLRFASRDDTSTPPAREAQVEPAESS